MSSFLVYNTNINLLEKAKMEVSFYLLVAAVLIWFAIFGTWFFIRFVTFFVLYKFFTTGYLNYPAWKAALFATFFIKSKDE